MKTADLSGDFGKLKRKLSGQEFKDLVRSGHEGLENVEFVFIAVNTPEGMEGEADLRYVRSAAQQIAQELDHDAVIINKSTVPIGTGDLVAGIVERHIRPGVLADVVSNPEFLREGSAVYDCQHPDRVVLGSSSREAAFMMCAAT